MRSHLLTALVTTSLLAASAAFAAQPTIGSVGSYERSAGTFYLSGNKYQIPSDMPRKALQDGDEVAVQWVPQGDLRVVRSFDIRRNGADTSDSN